MTDNNIELPYKDLLMSIMDNVAKVQTDVATLMAHSVNHTESLKRIEHSTKEEHGKLSNRIDDHDLRISNVEKDMLELKTKASTSIIVTRMFWAVFIVVSGITLTLWRGK